jgi:hypothetical protein
MASFQLWLTDFKPAYSMPHQKAGTFCRVVQPIVQILKSIWWTVYIIVPERSASASNCQFWFTGSCQCSSPTCSYFHGFEYLSNVAPLVTNAVVKI